MGISSCCVSSSHGGRGMVGEGVSARSVAGEVERRVLPTVEGGEGDLE